MKKVTSMTYEGNVKIQPKRRWKGTNHDELWLYETFECFTKVIKRNINANIMPTELEELKEFIIKIFNQSGLLWYFTTLKPSFETYNENELIVNISDGNYVYGVYKFDFEIVDE